MKNRILLFTLLAIIASCQSNDKAELIAKTFDLELPANCYEVLEGGEQKFDFNPHTIIELKFEEECMWKMYKEQMKPLKGECGKYYAGTTLRLMMDYAEVGMSVYKLSYRENGFTVAEKHKSL